MAEEIYVDMIESDLANDATVSISRIRADGGAAALRSVLERNGFAIVTDVLSSDEITKCEELWREDLSAIIDVATSKNKELANHIMSDPVLRWPWDELPLGKTFASDFGVPHGRMGWFVRRNRSIKEVYEKIYSDCDLIVSMDNIFFNPRGALSADDSRSKLTSRAWPHTDQNSRLKPEGDYDIFQGVVHIWPAGETTSCTVVWPLSHTSEYHKLCREEGDSATNHFVLMHKRDHQRFAQFARRVAVPAGGLLLWNSRTIHQGWKNGPRLALPICFQPRWHRTDEAAYHQKMASMFSGLPTTHWASMGSPHRVAATPRGPKLFDNGVSIVHAAHKHLLSPGGTDDELLAIL